ncbi:MAG: AEC family transporter [Verrucomicrobiota bacterium]
MSGEILQVFTAVLPIFCILILGFLLRRGHLLTREADRSILRITINVLIPCLIWDSILGNTALDTPSNAWAPPLVGFFTAVFGFFLARALSPLVGLKDIVERRTFGLTAGLYNWAYLALPICVILFGKETVGVLFVHNLGVEVAMWTIGLMMLTGETSGRGWRQVVNGPVVAIVSALIFHFLGAHHWLPEFFTNGLSMLGASAIPIGLLLVGATFYDYLGEAAVFKHSRVGASAVLVRLGLLPILFLAAAYILPVSDELRNVIVVQAAMPSAVFPVIMSKHYGGHVPTALRIVLWTTLVGFITMPLWINIGIHLFSLSVNP